MTCNWKTQADEIEFSEVISMKGVENENKNVKQMRIEYSFEHQLLSDIL